MLVDSCWAEFDVPCIPQRPIPLIDAVPLAAWIYIKPEGIFITSVVTLNNWLLVWLRSVFLKPSLVRFITGTKNLGTINLYHLQPTTGLIRGKNIS